MYLGKYTVLIFSENTSKFRKVPVEKITLDADNNIFISFSRA